MLEGKKTHIVAVVAALITGLHYLGHLDNNTYMTVMGFLGAGGLSALRMGVK